MRANAPIVVSTPDMRDSTMGIVRSLAGANLLRACVTTLALSPKTPPLAWLPSRMQRAVLARARSRAVPEDIDAPFQALFWRETLRLAAARSGLTDVAVDRVWEWAEHGFDREVARRWAGRAPCIYGCEHAALETFRKQRAAGGFNLHWQVIAHHTVADAIVREEAERFPHASTAYLRHALHSQARVGRRKQQQLELADLIVCNSEYVRRTCVDAGLSPQRVVAVPSGCPRVATDSIARRAHARRNVFVYAGTLSLRKGVPYLLEAWSRLKPPATAELWLIGHSELPSAMLHDLPANVQVRPPMLRARLFEQFARAAVFVFPTLCEGRARVVLEAAASGLALLTTPNSGCEDIVEPGVNGWLVSARDSDAVAERIAWFLDHPARLPEMWDASLEKARSWGETQFVSAHLHAVRGFLSGHGLA